MKTMNNQTKRCFDSYQIISTLLSNNLFGKDCIVKDMGDYIEVDTIHAGKVAIGASKYLEGGWSYSYGHYMWQISDTIQEYRGIHRGPFSCNLYPFSEVSHMVNDIEKEYIRREKYKCNIMVLNNRGCL